MAILSEISQTISSFVAPRKPNLEHLNVKSHVSKILEQRSEEEPVSAFTKTKDWLESSPDNQNVDDLEGDTLLDDGQQSAKRFAPGETVQKRPAKRHKSDDAYRHSQDEVDSDFEGETLLESTPGPKLHVRSNDKAHEDRQAMPPPPKPTIRLDDQPYIPSRVSVDTSLQDYIPRKRYSTDSVLSEEEIFTKRTAVRREDRSEVNVQFEYDRALRHAEAQQLPEDSSVWSEAEKDLFYRLAMRGFEPILPGHWGMDFKTLPLQLFSTEGQDPLILPFDNREFRAKHYLRELFTIAAKARDRSLAGLRPEVSIKRILQQYISWALHDAGVHPMQRPRVIPVHAIATQRLNETSQDVIRRMEKKLYKLARRYQDLYRVRRSIEPTIEHATPLPPPPDSQKTQASPSHDVFEYDDAHMPTLIGLMVVSSVVAVVTLDSRSKVPEQTIISKHNNESISEQPSSGTNESSSPLRFIANFDFSTHDGYDVWDGLAMAICIMRIRKTMLELCEVAEREGMTGLGGVWERIR